jgi:hypothetical protein
MKQVEITVTVQVTDEDLPYYDEDRITREVENVVAINTTFVVTDSRHGSLETVPAPPATCTAEMFGSPHTFDGTPVPDGIREEWELCDRPADDPIHQVDEADHHA